MNGMHGHGLAEDLPLIEKQLLARRHALRLMALSSAAVLLPACGGGDASAGTDTTTSGTTGTTGTTVSNAACIVNSTETNGPYPADGTNTASGSTSNVLTLASAVRSDIRASFLGTSTVAAGTRVDLTIRLVNAQGSCAGLAGRAIYLWHCDALGRYSLYDLPNESYLRGIQVTDANGYVTFTTIFPGAYAGRYPHIHFEVFSSLAAATTGRSSLLVSQFAMPASQATAVYADTTLYGSSATRFPQTPLASDNVFGDNTAAQNTQQTIAMTGSNSAGYTGTVLVGINA
ncbi:MAG: intradiol ring-cleavage dioxygenase [Massilia sp.]